MTGKVPLLDLVDRLDAVETERSQETRALYAEARAQRIEPKLLRLLGRLRRRSRPERVAWLSACAEVLDVDLDLDPEDQWPD